MKHRLAALLALLAIPIPLAAQDLSADAGFASRVEARSGSSPRSTSRVSS